MHRSESRPRALFQIPEPQTWPTLHANLLAAAAKTNLLPLLLAAAAKAAPSRAEGGNFTGEKFPPRAQPALASRPPKPPVPHPAAAAVRLAAPSSRGTRQPKHRVQDAHAPYLRRRRSAPPGAVAGSSSAGAPRPGRVGHQPQPPQCPPRARRGWSAQRRSGRRRRRGGLQAEEKRRRGRGRQMQTRSAARGAAAGRSAGSRVCS